MNTTNTAQIRNLFPQRICHSFRFRLSLAALCVAALTSAQAQVQTAGALYINIDATTNAAGANTGSNVFNSGTLAGYFDANTNTAIASTNNVNAVMFAGTNNLQLRTSQARSSSLIAPPAGIVGVNPTCSIEVWALNPQVADDESMVAWGVRANNANMAFEYGYNGGGGTNFGGAGGYGAVQHNANVASADMPWDPIGGCPLNNYWHHLVYTSDGTTEKVYSDGVLVNSRPVSCNVATTNGFALGAQWSSTGGTNSTSPAFATLYLARVRVHSGALTAAQVLNNFQFEQSTFISSAPAPAFLTSGPIHRYSFNEAPTNDATGLLFHDSVGTADGSVVSSELNEVARFSGRRLVLPGGISITYPAFNNLGASTLNGHTDSAPGYGAPYGALPANIISTNSANNGGSGEVSVEAWFKTKTGTPTPFTWGRVFEFGSVGSNNTPSIPYGIAIPPPLGAHPSLDPYAGRPLEPGDFPGPNWGQWHYFGYLAMVGGANLNQRRLEWQWKYNTSTNTNITISKSVDAQMMGTLGTDRHVVVTWKEITGLINAYENGVLVSTLFASNTISALNDVNCWIGRSLNNDSAFAGEFDELRIYNYVLSQSQAVGNFLAGPDTVNAGAQAPTIATQPQSQTVNQGWPAAFYVIASGSPPISYQWSRNGAAIPGATTDTYTLAAASLANDGDAYSCVLSNFANSTPNVVNSTTNTLNVSPNVALPAQILHETEDANPTATGNNVRDNYGGSGGNAVGCILQAGPSGALVTHLGYYDVWGDGLVVNHRVGILSGDGSTVLYQVTVPAGASAFLTNGYRYMPLTNGAGLPAPAFLAPNTSYLLQAEVFGSDNDSWHDAWVPGLWNPYFVGNLPIATRQARYSSGAWPAPVTGASTGNGLYSAPNMAVLPIGPASAWIAQTTITQYAGLSVTVPAGVNGEAPVAAQWYKVGSPDTALPGQTGTSISFANVDSTNAGTYYLAVSNSVGGVSFSPNVTLTILPNSPVLITQEPANVTVPAGYPAIFTVSASGTPPIFYQWSRNGTPIAGATTNTYMIAAASMTNNGDQYTCFLSNHTATANTTNSSIAVLTVQPNIAPVNQSLFYLVIGGFRDNSGGEDGAIFQVGGTPALVTHLGYYCTNTQTLNMPHHVGIFPATGGSVPIVQVIVPAGDQINIVSNYSYMPITNGDGLPSPIVLAANTSYILSTEVMSGSGDPWPDVSVPSVWNTYFVGTNGAGSRTALWEEGLVWPQAPYNLSSGNGIYGPGNLALLPQGTPIIVMSQTDVYQYQGSTLTVSASVDGAPPLTVQWYKSPSTLLSGQTNATLSLANLAPGDAGAYYLAGHNPQGDTNGNVVNVHVLTQSSQVILQSPQSQTAYSNQLVTFTVGVAVPPLGYQWTFNGSPIAGATSSSYSTIAGAANAGASYRVMVTNNFGTATSTVAVLTVVVPQVGNYDSAVLAANPLIYYRFSDAVPSNTVAFNEGSLGVAFNGVYEGNYTNVAGPQPPTWQWFETNNEALGLGILGIENSTIPADDLVDVSIPSLNVTSANVTFAAWVNSQNNDTTYNQYGGIIFARSFGFPPTPASGLDVKQDPNVPGTYMLNYHWNNLYFGNNTFLDLPTGQWAFAALTISPSQAIFYLNDGTGMKTYTNNNTHAAVTFNGPAYVGWDDNDAVHGLFDRRRFVGSIDEPMIFGRTLAPNEITNLYLAAVTAPAVTLQITPAGTNVILTWPIGTLQQADSGSGTYNSMNGVTSPYTNTVSGTQQKFYRVKVQ